MTKVIQHIYFLPLVICAILSLKAFRLRWPMQYRIFSILLFFILLVEIIVFIWKKNHPSNYAPYTIAIVPFYALYMSVYYFELKNKAVKKGIIIMGALLTIFTVVNATYWQKLSQINSYSHLFADCIILLLVFVYLEQLRTEKETVSLSTQPMIWISLGTGAYHLLNIPYIFGMRYLISYNESFAYSFHYVYLVFQCIMYFSYAKAFLCPTPQQK